MTGPPPVPVADRPGGGKRRRLVARSSFSLWPTSPLGCPASPQQSPTTSPALWPRSPPIDLDSADWWSPKQLREGCPRRYALEELRRYVADWAAAPQDEFWHRKSGKPVLSVVVCAGRGGGLVAHRGMNTEVSLPAGSLCAERAAIGRAASSFQQASDILVVATVDPQDRLNPLWPCEVCQSWFAKLRSQSPEISVMAVESSTCDSFVVRVNGEIQSPPLPPLPPLSLSGSAWRDCVALAEGTDEVPWDAQELVYVDGAWTFLHSAQQNILKVARSRGTHLLVGIHSDEVLSKECHVPVLECIETRTERVLHNRHVSSVLRNAPWILTKEFLDSFGVHRVITGSVDKLRDVGKEDQGTDPYGVARGLGILEVIPSINDTTECGIRESHAARALEARV